MYEREKTFRVGRNAANEEFKKLFTEADEDKDDHLNLDEYLSFVDKCEDAKDARDEPSVLKTRE